METSTKFAQSAVSSVSAAEEISRSEVAEFRAWQAAKREADLEHAAWLEAKAKSDAERAFAEKVAAAVAAALPQQQQAAAPSAKEVAEAVAATQRAEARRVLGAALTNGLRVGLVAAGVAAYATIFTEGMRKLERAYTTGTTYPSKEGW